jgi:signal transduction histidine kinase
MEKETSCINARAILNYVKEYNKGDLCGLLDNLDPEIDSMPDPEGFFYDSNNWISCDVISELYKRAKLIFHNEMVAYDIGRYAVENVSMGYTQRIIVKAFWSTKKGIIDIQRINDRLNRNKDIELVEINGGKAVVRLHWKKNMNSSKDICLYNQGVYVHMPRVWGGKPLKLEEMCCYFNGAPYCEYHLKWTARNRLHEVFSRFFTTRSVLTETINEMEADKKIIEQKYEEVNRLNVELNQRVKQLQAVQETGKAILSVLDLEKLLTVIMNRLSNICSIDRAIIMLVNEKEECLEYLYATGFKGDVPDEILEYKVPLNRLNNILARVANTGKSEYVSDVEDSSLRKGNIILTYGKPKSVYVVPLITKSKVTGVIATDAVDNSGVPKETRDTLEIFSPQIAIAIENARLYRRLKEQMLELQRSYSLLGRAEKLSFLGNVAARLAHEIKNPMTSIGTFIQMLPYKYKDEDYRGKFHKTVVEETNRVNNLISELMDLVKTKESNFALNDLHELIDKMVMLISAQSKAKKIRIDCKYDPGIGKVWLDSEKIRQVVLNILSNAVDATPEEGRIEISTRHNNKEGKDERIEIFIKDNGEGIPRSNIDKIFEPYFTTKHKSSLHSGTGLGLFVSHQNIQEHGGTIEVKSKVNKGTTFILTLPCNSSEGTSKCKE